MKHPSHTYLTAQASQISPPSPQMWTGAVNNYVYNPRSPVRNVDYVRLSPFVDRLWTRSPWRRRSSWSSVHSRRPVVHIGDRPWRRPHHIPRTIRAAAHPLHTPHQRIDEAEGSLSTLSPTPMTTTTFHHRNRMGTTTLGSRWTTPVPSGITRPANNLNVRRSVEQQHVRARKDTSEDQS